MPRSCDLPKTLWFEKKRKTSTAQAHETFGHLVLLDYNVQVLRINHWEIMSKILGIFLTGVRTHLYAPCMSTSLFKIIENGTFDRSHTTSCQSAVVSIALCCTVFEIFNVKKYRDFEIRSLGGYFPCEFNSFYARSVYCWNWQTWGGWQCGFIFTQFYTASSRGNDIW